MTAAIHPVADWHARYSRDRLQYWRGICDPLADAAAAGLRRARPSQMLDQVEAGARAGDAACARFLDVTSRVPDWVDRDEVEQGRRVSLAFSAARSLGMLAGLMEGYSMNRGAHVLVATGRLNQDVARRLSETGQMNHNMSAAGSLMPGGLGHRHILEVRLLHAMVRRHLRNRGWDAATWDEPINQEDMAFTVIEFDHLSICAMQRLGIELRSDDREAIHHFWRYAAWLHGVDEALISRSPAEEAFLCDAIRAHQQEVNEESRALATAVLAGLAGQPPLYVSERLLRALVRAMLDEPLAHAYGLRPDTAMDVVVGLLRQSNRLQTAAHYRLPGFARFSERAHFALTRRALRAQLGEAGERAFRGMA